MCTISLNITTCTTDIADQLDHETAEKLIIAVDLAMADYDFTLEITKKLVAALKEEHEAVGEEFNLADLEV